MRLALSLVGFDFAVLLLVASCVVQPADAVAISGVAHLPDVATVSGVAHLADAATVSHVVQPADAATVSHVVQPADASTVSDVEQPAKPPTIPEIVRLSRAATIPTGVLGKLSDLWDGATTRIRSIFGLQMSQGALIRQFHRHPAQFQADAYYKGIKLDELGRNGKTNGELSRHVTERHELLGVTKGSFYKLEVQTNPAIARYTRRINSFETALKGILENNAGLEASRTRTLWPFHAQPNLEKTAPRKFKQLLNEYDKIRKTLKAARERETKVLAVATEEHNVLPYLQAQSNRLEEQKQRLFELFASFMKKYPNAETEDLRLPAIKNRLPDSPHQGRGMDDGPNDNQDKFSRAASPDSDSSIGPR